MTFLYRANGNHHLIATIRIDEQEAIALDSSVFCIRQPDTFKGAFSPAPLSIWLTESGGEEVPNFMKDSMALSCCFRALTQCMVLHSFRLKGLPACLREHIRLAQLLMHRVKAFASCEHPARTIFSVICFCSLPRHMRDKAPLRGLQRTTAQPHQCCGLFFPFPSQVPWLMCQWQPSNGGNAWTRRLVCFAGSLQRSAISERHRWASPLASTSELALTRLSSQGCHLPGLQVPVARRIREDTFVTLWPRVANDTIASSALLLACNVHPEARWWIVHQHEAKDLIADAVVCLLALQKRGRVPPKDAP